MRRLLLCCAAACGHPTAIDGDAAGGADATRLTDATSDAASDALPVLISTISSCTGASGACAETDLASGGHSISKLLFGDGIEWDNYGQDVLAPDQTGMTAGTLRPDVMAALGAVGFTLMRYPGGTLADQFHWQQATGPVASRVPQPTFDKDSMGHAITEVPLFGPDEFAGFAQTLGTEILVTVNVATGTAQEAASWISYWESEGVTVKYVEVGNETYIGGPTFAAVDPVTYAADFDAYAAAIRAVDPAIQIGAIGTSDTSAWCYPSCATHPWNEQVLLNMHAKADFFAIHDAYAPGTADDGLAVYQTMMSAPAFGTLVDALVAGDIDYFGNAQTKGIPLAITEHASYFLTNATDAAQILSDLGRNQTWAAALYSALTYDVLLESGRITIANHINPLSYVWQAPVTVSVPGSDVSLYDPQPMQSAFGVVFAAYRELAGAQATPVAVTGSPTITTAASVFVPALTDTPVLDAIAARGDHASWLFLVNRSLTDDVATSFVLDDLPASTTTLRIEQLSADYLAKQVSWAPLSYGALPVGGTTFGTTITIPKCSLVRIRVE